MRTTNTVSNHVDTGGWVASGAAFGLVAAHPWLGQLLTGLLTMAVGVVMVHFLKLALNYYWPQPQKRQRKRKAAPTETQ